jgi:ferrous iron transport protein B
MGPTIQANPAAPPRSGLKLVVVAGNPNTGKTTLFNQLTGSRAKVGNYPGVTVERHVGALVLEQGGLVSLVDVPGSYSLAARSGDEAIAIRALAGLDGLERPDLVVAVVDASQLTRNLYLVLQLLELGEPCVVALNMVDLLERSGQEIDAALLARELGVPVVPVVANRGIGLDLLRRVIDETLAHPQRAQPGPRWRPQDPLAADVESVAERVPSAWHRGSSARARAFALWGLLTLDHEDEVADAPRELRERVRGARTAADLRGRDIEEEIIRGRYSWIDREAARCVHSTRAASPSLTDRVDRVLLHPALGFVIFVTLMTLVFQGLFAWSDPAIGAIESGIAWLGDRLAVALPNGIASDFLVHGVVAGVGAVLAFLPQILLLFLFIGILEDTGYMARVGFLMDRIMKSIGLHGRAFVPMLSGYACAIPAILATRTMERRRDRLLTMLVIPLMTCSARLPVYGLLIAALVPAGQERPLTQGLLLAAMYLFSTVVALVAAAVLGRTILQGPRVPFLLEMPPYRLPHAPSVLRMMLERCSQFVRQAGTIILACSIGMWLLLSFPRDAALARHYDYERGAARAALSADPPALQARLAQLGHAQASERIRESFGGRIGRALEPILRPLGFDWKIGVGLIGAFAAREVFVSTMAVVYGLGKGEDVASSTLRERVRAEAWPDGRKVFTPLTCFSLMVFFALACQCTSTLAVLRRETGGWRWPTFLFAYTTALAWLASLIVYQGGHLLGFE